MHYTDASKFPPLICSGLPKYRGPKKFATPSRNLIQSVLHEICSLLQSGKVFQARSVTLHRNISATALTSKNSFDIHIHLAKRVTKPLFLTWLRHFDLFSPCSPVFYFCFLMTHWEIDYLLINRSVDICEVSRLFHRPL